MGNVKLTLPTHYFKKTVNEDKKVRRLNSCKPRHRCGNASCELCGIAFQRWFCDMVRKEFGHTQNLSAVSIVLPELLYETSELPFIQLQKVTRRIRDLIASAGLDNRSWMGIIDISLNVNLAPKKSEQWSLHCMLITTEITRHFSRKLKKEISPHPNVPRPVKITPIYDLSGICKYVAKPTFVKRVSYFSESGKRNTKKYPLSGSPLTELNLTLSRYRHENRLVLVNLRRNGAALVRPASHPVRD